MGHGLLFKNLFFCFKLSSVLLYGQIDGTEYLWRDD